MFCSLKSIAESYVRLNLHTCWWSCSKEKQEDSSSPHPSRLLTSICLENWLGGSKSLLYCCTFFVFLLCFFLFFCFICVASWGFRLSISDCVVRLSFAFSSWTWLSDVLHFARPIPFCLLLRFWSSFSLLTFYEDTYRFCLFLFAFLPENLLSFRLGMSGVSISTLS